MMKIEGEQKIKEKQQSNAIKVSGETEAGPDREGRSKFFEKIVCLISSPSQGFYE